jgi:hypothetical protein
MRLARRVQRTQGSRLLVLVEAIATEGSSAPAGAECCLFGRVADSVWPSEPPSQFHCSQGHETAGYRERGARASPRHQRKKESRHIHMDTSLPQPTNGSFTDVQSGR